MNFALSNIANISAGHPFRGRIPEKSGSDIRVVQMKNVSAGNGICWDDVIETELEGKKKPDWLMAGDVLFVARGGRNYAVLVDQVKGRVVSAPHFYILRVKEPSLLPEFLVWQLNQKPLQNYFERVAEGSVTKSIRRAILENTEISVPPLYKQEEIMKLNKIVQREKALYAELISNSDKLINSIASDLMSGKNVKLKEKRTA